MTGKSALKPGLAAGPTNLLPLRAGILIGYLVSGQDTDPDIYVSFKCKKAHPMVKYSNLFFNTQGYPDTT